MRTKVERMHNTRRVQNRRMRLANQWGIPDKSKHPQRWGLFRGEFRKRPTKCQCRRCRRENPKNHSKGKNKKEWRERPPERFYFYCDKTSYTNGRCPMPGEKKNICLQTNHHRCPNLMIVHEREGEE